jgi:hypothetical protein
MDRRMFWGHFEPQGVTGIPSLMNNYATIAADGSVGFSTASNVASLWVSPTDVRRSSTATSPSTRSAASTARSSSR